MSTRDLARKGGPVAILAIILLIVAMFIYFPPSGKMVCKFSSAPGDPHADYIYTVNFKLWTVKNVETKQVITSSNKELLENYLKLEKEIIEKYKKLNFFKREVSIKDKELTSITIIDYKKMDYNAFEKVETKAKIKNKNIRVGTMKKLYQKIGATCSYK